MKYLEIPKWSDFQHYTDRDPIWIKVYNRLLDHYEFSCLTDAQKGHVVCIWLLASRQGPRENPRVPADPGWIEKRMSATEPVDLEPLINAGFLCLVDAEEDDASKSIAGYGAGSVSEENSDASKPLAGYGADTRADTRSQEQSRGEESRAEESREEIPAGSVFTLPASIAPLAEAGELQEIREAIASTRKGGKITEGKWEGILTKLGQYPTEVVRHGFEVYTGDHHHLDGKREEYLYGICRKMLERKEAGDQWRQKVGADRRKPQGPGQGIAEADDFDESRCPGCGEEFDKPDRAAHMWEAHPKLAKRFRVKKPKGVERDESGE